jgi:hypothetical protein
MSYLGCDAPASTGFGQVANSATMDSILLFIQLLRQDTQQIQNQNQDILSRIHAIESKVLHLSSGVGEALLQGGTQRRMTLLTDRREHSVTTLKEKITRDIR